MDGRRDIVFASSSTLSSIKECDNKIHYSSERHKRKKNNSSSPGAGVKTNQKKKLLLVVQSKML